MGLLYYSTYNAEKLIPNTLKLEIKESILSVLDIKKAPVTRDGILSNLRNKFGWSDEVKLCVDAKITITSKKNEIGLCLQTGNVSRFYADLLKLEYLFNQGLISSAIYILPDKKLANNWGDNIARYDRFVKELNIFSSIIKVPILVYGIENR